MHLSPIFLPFQGTKTGFFCISHTLTVHLIAFVNTYNAFPGSQKNLPLRYAHTRRSFCLSDPSPGNSPLGTKYDIPLVPRQTVPIATHLHYRLYKFLEELSGILHSLQTGFHINSKKNGLEKNTRYHEKKS